MRNGKTDRVEHVLDAGATELATRYGKSAEDDHRVRFVLSEIGPARYAFERAMAESGGPQILGHMMFLRLVAEIGVRFAWIAARGDGRLDPTRSAVDALAKRDFIHLRAAIKALRQSTDHVDEQIAGIAVPEAPRQFDQLGTSTPLAANSYSMFRFASALIHPGFGLRDLIRGVPDMEIGLRGCMTTCVALGAELLAVLAPAVPPYDADRLLGHPILSLSAPAISIRLRRHLRENLGTAAPSVTNLAMTTQFSREGGEVQTLEAELQSAATKLVVSASAPDTSEAYARLRGAAITAFAGETTRKSDG
jgi:hypothetical protein